MRLAPLRSRSGIRTLTGETGIALFLVLWVLMLLSVIVAEFCYAMRTGATIAFNFRSQAEGYYIALAGINRGIAEMMRNALISPATLQRVDREAKKEDDEEKTRWRVNAPIPSIPFGKGEFEVVIGNESGKVNLNQASEAALEMVLGTFDLKERTRDTIVDSIMDWRDADDLHRVNGAEDDYYQSLSEPYDCKDADFDTVEELLLVRGITPELFYGGLREMVTVAGSGKKNRQARGTARLSTNPLMVAATGGGSTQININAASRRMLLSLPMMTDEIVDKIMAYREESDFKNLNEVASVVGYDVYPGILPFIGLDLSPYYTISSVGKVDGTSVRQGLSGLFEINPRLKKGYKVLQWHDGARYEGSGEEGARGKNR